MVVKNYYIATKLANKLHHIVCVYYKRGSTRAPNHLGVEEWMQCCLGLSI